MGNICVHKFSTEKAKYASTHGFISFSTEILHFASTTWNGMHLDYAKQHARRFTQQSDEQGRPHTLFNTKPCTSALCTQKLFNICCLPTIIYYSLNLHMYICTYVHVYVLHFSVESFGETSQTDLMVAASLFSVAFEVVDLVWSFLFRCCTF